MVGRELNDRFPERSTFPGAPLLEVRALSSMHTGLENVSFTLRRGEVLGVAGLDGSGRTELLECIFGISRKKSGEILLSGIPMQNRTPKEAKRNGFALLTEERRRDGIFGALSIRENVTISSLPSYSRLFILNSKSMSEATQDGIYRLKIKTPSEKTRIRSLSGGNQQKVILARWLLTKPKILLLDEPTRGIDIGANYEIYQLINSLVEDGLGVIMVSSEMSELIGMSDRILVMSGGLVAGILDKASATQEQIMTLAAKNL